MSQPRRTKLCVRTQNASIAAQVKRGWPGQPFRNAKVEGRLSMAKNKTKPRTAIYHPPKSGMPYLVVTVSPEGVTATAVESKDEARILASKRTMKILIQDGTGAP